MAYIYVRRIYAKNGERLVEGRERAGSFFFVLCFLDDFLNDVI